MSSASRVSTGKDAVRSRPKIVPGLLLTAGFVLAVFPVFHWLIDSAVTAMAYVIGTSVFITAAIIVIYVLDRRSAVSGLPTSEEK